MGATRVTMRKQYQSCRTCEHNIEDFGKCKKGFENFYCRRSKSNGCDLCKEEMRMSRYSYYVKKK